MKLIAYAIAAGSATWAVHVARRAVRDGIDATYAGGWAASLAVLVTISLVAFDVALNI